MFAVTSIVSDDYVAKDGNSDAEYLLFLESGGLNFRQRTDNTERFRGFT
jgi:hypothetical protein